MDEPIDELEQAADAEFEAALDAEIADWKQAVIASVKERQEQDAGSKAIPPSPFIGRKGLVNAGIPGGIKCMIGTPKPGPCPRNKPGDSKPKPKKPEPKPEAETPEPEVQGPQRADVEAQLDAGETSVFGTAVMKTPDGMYYLQGVNEKLSREQAVDKLQENAKKKERAKAQVERALPLVKGTCCPTDPKATAALKLYSGEDNYQKINQGLRSGKLDKTSRDVADAISQTLKALPPLPEPVKVYRGMQLPKKAFAKVIGDFQKSQKSKKAVALKGFTSTSITEETASNFTSLADGQPVLLEIDARKGMYMEPMTEQQGEHEFLIDNASKFEVVSITEGNPYRIKMRQLT